MKLNEASVAALCSLALATKEFERRFAKVENFDWTQIRDGIDEPWMAPNRAGRYRTFCGPFEKAEFAPIPLDAVGIDPDPLVSGWLKGLSSIFITPGSALYWRIRPSFQVYDGSKTKVYIRCRMTWGKVTC